MPVFFFEIGEGKIPFTGAMFRQDFIFSIRRLGSLWHDLFEIDRNR
jgi:hypothetical protein